MTDKPWDSRIAYRLVYPLRHTGVRPNHITTLSLLVGLAAGVLYGVGEAGLANWAGLLFMCASLIDHCDGELARLTGRTTRQGHFYDFAVDFIIYMALFIGIGAGLYRAGTMGAEALVLGTLAGVAVAGIFALRAWREWRGATFEQPRAGGFEVQDIMYLIGPITWLGLLQTFFLAAAIGAPLYAAWMTYRHWFHIIPEARP